MMRHYTTPVLLIEFDPDKPFLLGGSDVLSGDIEFRNTMSKLVLLILASVVGGYPFVSSFVISNKNLLGK